MPSIMTDSAAVLRTLVAPASSFAALVERPRSWVALAVATLLALCAAAVTVPRTDHGPGLAAAAAAPDGQPAPEPTEFERAQSAATARKLGQLGGWADAALMPSVLALLAAAGLTLGFRVAGAQASFRPTLAVAAHGMLPIWLARLLAAPAALAHAPVPAGELAQLLPSSPAALLPPGASPALAGALGGLDLFALWAVWLVALGMARLTGATRARALVTTAVLYLAYVAVFRIALPSALLPSGAPGAIPG